MSHMSIKRFDDNDPKLTPGAKRNRALHPYVACIEVDPSGRSKCKSCGTMLMKDTIRYALMMECHQGYRGLCTLHEECFYQHPETKKIYDFNEIYIKNKTASSSKKNNTSCNSIDANQVIQLKERFDSYLKSNNIVKNEPPQQQQSKTEE